MSPAGAREPARFVVGTGRCGSTLLTKMLDQHGAVLGLNEVFTGLDWERRFVEDPVSGTEVADLLGTPNHVIDMVLGKGYDAEEVTYPFRSQDRYRRGDPMPWILTSTLGHLSDDPDGLWDEVARWLTERGLAPIGDQYRALFDHLAQRADKAAWVERSGSSVQYVEGLVRTFPDALVVHLVRDGREVALSMRNHPFYRLAVQLFYGVMPDGVDPDDEDAVVRGWLEGDPPVELYGRYWSDQLCDGEPTLAALSAERLRTIRFEDVVRDPGSAMERLAQFLQLPDDPAFSAAAASLVRGVPPARFGELAPWVRDALDKACGRGDAVLRRLDGRRDAR